MSLQSLAVTERVVHQIMVLLVDDQPFVAEMLRRALVNEADINLHYCHDPSQAVSVAEKIGPTVILLDITMPDLDGLTVCKLLRVNPVTCDIPVVMLSSNDDPVTKAASFAAGAHDYMVKLPDSLELIARLRYHSDSYINKLQRDDAYRALSASQVKLAELNLQLLKLANVDGLTGISNRRYFDQRLGEEWYRALRNRNPLTLIMFDIDFFKKYNDKFGHLEGDECLKQVVRCTEKIINRPADTLARYGGEEFIVLLPETDSNGAQKIAEKIRTEIEKLHLPNPDSTVIPFVTISAGVITTVPEAQSNQNACLHLVDEALYRAKEAGRNRISIAPHPVE